MNLKDISKQDYQRIKDNYGDDYIYHYHLALANENGITQTTLFNKLKSFSKPDDNYYILSLYDQHGNCLKIGYTALSTISYYMNFISNRKNHNISVSDIEIMEVLSDKKEAIKKCKDLKKSLIKFSRKYKIENL